MNKIKFVVSILLVFAMIIPMSSYALFDEMDVVCAPESAPVIDAVINKDDGWSDPVALNTDKLVVISHNKQNAVDMNAKAYLAYNEEAFYFGAEITEFGEGMNMEFLRCASNIEEVSNDTYGFDGDVFGITVDFMSLLSCDPANYEKSAPYYCVGFDAEGNGAVYRSNGAANEILSAPNAYVKVVFTDNGWNFEARIKNDIIFQDIAASLGISELDDLQIFEYLYGNLDSKANFVYKSNRIDIEAEEVITYAEYASVAETTLDGHPGVGLFGSPVKSFGITFYLNHEHHMGGYFFKSEDDYATFTNDGYKYKYCLICGELYEKEIIPIIPFEDVKAGAWYEDAISRCYSREYFNGMTETEFGPNKSMTRAMFVQVLANFNGVDTSNWSTDVFSDVKPANWYYGAVSWAYKNGISSGVSDNKFAPNKAITRQEAACLFANFLKLEGMYNPPAITEFDSKYTDSSKIASWAEESMLWAVENGIIAGTSATILAPAATATRIQVAQMLCNFEDYVVSLIEAE